MTPEDPSFLVADDDADTRALLKRVLQLSFPGCSVLSISDPSTLVKLAATAKPQVAFIDWFFPHGTTGPQLCRRLKSQHPTRNTAVVLITGLRHDSKSRFKAARSGADLLLKKPLLAEEVEGYARALLERTKANSDVARLRLGPLFLDREQRTGLVGRVHLPPLPPRLFEVLWRLARRSPEPANTRELVHAIWEDVVRDKHVTVAISRLRKRLADFDALRFEHVAGAGYRLVVR